MASRKYRFQQYLKGRKIDVDIDTGFLGTGILATSGNYHKYSAQGYVIVTVSPIILRSPTTQKIAHKFDGGDAMTVTGVDDSGNFIVSSWGDKYILNPDDYKFYHTLKFEVVNY